MAVAAASSEIEARLAAVVARTWRGARIDAADWLAGDASARRYVRLRLAGGAPATTVAMVLPGANAGASEEITAVATATAELPFVSVGRFLAAGGVPVPETYADASSEGFLLLEDIGDQTLAAAAAASESEGAARLGEAADVLARLAALVRRPDAACPAFAARYDRALIARELEVVHTHGLAPSDAGPPRAVGSDPEVEAALSALGDALAAQPDVLMHRDYHAWNLHVDPAGALRVIDFQDALIGPALYDLASLCTDRDSDRFVTPALERALVERFAGGLAERGGPDLGRGDELLAAYFAAAAYRTLRVIGRFRFLAIEKGKPGYLRFLPRMAQQTRRALEARGDGRLLGALAARVPIFARG